MAGEPDLMTDEFDIAAFITGVLEEDLGRGDLTTEATVPADAQFRASIVARAPIVVSGIELAAMFFRRLDPDMDIKVLTSDRQRAAPGQVLMRLSGMARAMLAAERSALNSLQHLCGIATLTGRYVDEIADTGCHLLDTRKTVPGLRYLEKYAARCGGARNHRMRLDDGILIKDNHIAAAGGIRAAVAAAVAHGSGLPVQVEVETLDQIEPALAAGAHSLLCDNMDLVTLREAVRIVGGRVPIEASGGVRLDTIRAIAKVGVQFVSVGRITQSAPAVDIGLDYLPEDQELAAKPTLHTLGEVR
jgi:nicotinate-nucleotide pyrophosphorylase (carboxylating)